LGWLCGARRYPYYYSKFKALVGCKSQKPPGCFDLLGSFTVHPGEHAAIIKRDTWDKVHATLKQSPRQRAARTRADTPALLKGLLYGPDGAAFSPTHTRKGGRLYRYYVSQSVLKHGAGSCPIGRVPADEIEAAVIERSEPRTDTALVTALARGFRWKRMLESGEFTTIAELAEREGVVASYVTRILRLALLAPETVEAIVDGRQEPDVTLARVLEPFPLDWLVQTLSATAECQYNMQVGAPPV
jgi:hypothetical protein